MFELSILYPLGPSRMRHQVMPMGTMGPIYVGGTAHITPAPPPYSVHDNGAVFHGGRTGTVGSAPVGMPPVEPYPTLPTSPPPAYTERPV